MKRYITARSHGQLVVQEKQWKMTRDYNELFSFSNPEDAQEQADDLNQLIKSIVNKN